MKGLTHATALVGRPVVTLAGEDVGQVKDVVYAARGHRIIGFTLAGRGVLAGPLRQSLPWEGVLAVGRDAVMVRDGQVLADRNEVAGKTALREQNVIGVTVLTEGGTALGTVEDVIIDVKAAADVVGYAIRTGEALPPAGRKAYLPLGEVSASGEALVVPEAVTDVVVDDLAALGAAIRASRARSEAGR
jgi:uncharacterized protein YrrD